MDQLILNCQIYIRIIVKARYACLFFERYVFIFGCRVIPKITNYYYMNKSSLS